MKNNLKQLSLLLIILISSVVNVVGQITVTKIENRNVNSQSYGFIYALPETVFKIEITYEKLTKIPGPLSTYTTEYLGVNDYISNKSIKYKVIDADVTSFQEADPNQLYQVQYSTERSKDAKTTSFTLSTMGGLLAYNAEAVDNEDYISENVNKTIIVNSEDGDFPYMSQYNRQEKIDTVIRKITIDTVTINRFLFSSSWVNKSVEDKAKDVALEIEKIRESRYRLISGYQEVNYGSSIAYMDGQLQKMENEYLELFLGKEQKSVESKTLYFIPSQNKKGGKLMEFDDGSSVTIKIIPDDISIVLPDNAATLPNSIYYRIPAHAEVTISSNNETVFSNRFVVNQLGSVSTVPLGNTKLKFDKETGNLINIIRD